MRSKFANFDPFPCYGLQTECDWHPAASKWDAAQHRLGSSGRKGRITWKPWSMTRWEAGEAISLGETVMGRSPTRLEYPSGSMLFYFFHGRLFTLWICIRFEDVSKKVSKKDDQRGCGSVFLGFFLDFLNLSLLPVFCKYSWEILMIHGKIMENPHKMYWCLYIQDFPWPDWITDGLRFHTWRGCLGPPWDCDGADWQVLQGEQAPGLKEIAARKELDGWTSRVQSLSWLNTL